MKGVRQTMTPERKELLARLRKRRKARAEAEHRAERLVLDDCLAEMWRRDEKGRFRKRRSRPTR
jgi:hypothetical protein